MPLKTLADIKDMITAELGPLGEQINALREQIGTLATAPRRYADHLTDGPLPGSNKGLDPGLRAARIMRAVALASDPKIRMSTEEILCAWGNADLAAEITAATTAYRAKAALGTQTIAGGGVFVPEQYAAEFIPLLYAQTMVRQLGARSVPLATYAQGTAGATASWVGENVTTNASAPTYGQLAMSRKKIESIVALSNDLLRSGDARVDGIVRDDMVMQLGLGIDLACLRGSGSAYTPRGILNRIAAGQKFNMTATPTLTTVMADLVKVIRLVDQANIPLVRPGFVLAPRTHWYLFGLLDSNGNPVFQAELKQGLLMGFPERKTTQIPINLGSGTNESELYFGDWFQLLIGEEGGLEVEAFPNGTYADSAGTLQSGISNDQTPIRALQVLDIVIRYDTAFAMVQALTWGA